VLLGGAGLGLLLARR